MTDHSLASRVQKRLDALAMSARAASQEAKLSTAFVTNILNGKSRSPRAENLARLSEVLRTTTGWLLRGEGEECVNDAPVAQLGEPIRLLELPTMPVLGDVAAGRWLEVEQHVDESRHSAAPIAPNPRWRADAQFGLVVRGTSINEYAEDGDVLHCVDITSTGLMPVNGDLVVVEQSREGGHERARTVKAYYLGEGETYELRAVSDDAEWQIPIHVPHREHSFVRDRGLRIEIVAVVIGVYKAMPNSRRR